MASMSALAGPLHGKANQECLVFLKNVLKEIGDPTNENAVTAYIGNLFNSGSKIFGFGHAVLRVEDPRATVQYELGKRIAPDSELFQLALTMRKAGSAFLKKQQKVPNPYPNIDAVSGSLLNACGLKDENYYTVLFGLSRNVGIAAQIVYERTQARGGKGLLIIRPKYIYNGPVR